MRFLGIFALCVALALPAHAESVKTQGAAGPEEIAAARTYTSWAAPFGQDRLAFVAVDETGTRLVAEFLGDGETVENWTRMVTLNIFNLPEGKEAQTAAIGHYITAFRDDTAALKDKGLALALKDFAAVALAGPGETEAVPQAAFYHFAVGRETPDEDNAGIIFPRNGRLYNLQVQRRGGLQVSDEDNERLRAMMMEKMIAPATGTGE